MPLFKASGGYDQSGDGVVLAELPESPLLRNSQLDAGVEHLYETVGLNMILPVANKETVIPPTSLAADHSR